MNSRALLKAQQQQVARFKRPVGRPPAETIAVGWHITKIAAEHGKQLCEEQKIAAGKLISRLIEEAYISSRRHV
jgi:hypothetical protein